jgi:hypothetical protein
MSATVAAASIVIVREQTEVVRTRFYSSTELLKVLAELRNGKSTGQLSINFSQGGISSVVFEESQKINA